MDSDNGNIVKIADFQRIARNAKKEKARKDKEANAAANRVRFGRTGHQKKLARRLNEKDAKAHDALRRETSAEENASRTDDEPPKA